MKGIFSLFLIVITISLYGCSKTQPSPMTLARSYVACRINDSASGSRCITYQQQFDQIGTLLDSLLINNNLGQMIMDVQMQLVTLQQEHAKKGLDDEKRRQTMRAINELEAKLRVYYSTFLIVSATTTD